jgi:hypothetical protein
MGDGETLQLRSGATKESATHEFRRLPGANFFAAVDI